jgi:predicted tellurium resistance membrane protein TerC
MERYPVVVICGAGLLGWVAGEMMISDPALGGWVALQLPSAHYLVPALGVLLVVVTGKWIERRHAARRDLTII